MGNLTIPSTSDVASGSRMATQSASVPQNLSQGGGVASGEHRQGNAVDVRDRVSSVKGLVDPGSGVYVLQNRNSETGEVKVQYPSAKVVSAYKRTEAASEPVASQSQPQNTASVGEKPAAATSADPVAAPASGGEGATTTPTSVVA